MKNLRPFNQEEFDKGCPAITREGRKVTEAYTFKSEATYPLRFTIEEKVICSAKADGRFNADGKESVNDIFMAPRTKTLWFCAYKLLGKLYATGMYASEKEMEKEVTREGGVIVKSQFIEVEDEEVK